MVNKRFSYVVFSTGDLEFEVTSLPHCVALTERPNESLSCFSSAKPAGMIPTLPIIASGIHKFSDVHRYLKTRTYERVRQRWGWSIELTSLSIRFSWVTFTVSSANRDLSFPELKSRTAGHIVLNAMSAFYTLTAEFRDYWHYVRSH